MKNLRRALRMAFRYKWSIICSSICAFLIAILWGANIGGILPIVEIVFKGNSLHTMVDERIERSQTAIANARTEINEAEAELAQADADQKRKLDRQIRLKEALIEDEQASIARTEYFEPWVKRYTPADPFSTLIMVFGVLFFGTVLRCFFLAINMYLVNRVGQRTVLDIQDHVFRNTLKMETHEIAEVKGTGDLISRIRGETSSISRAITTLFGKTLREPLKMGACIAGAAMVNWRLLLLSLVVVPIAGFVMLSIARLTKRAHRKAVEESAGLLNRLFQAVSNIVGNGVIKQHRLLRNVADGVAQIIDSVIANIITANSNFPRIRIKKSQQQINERAFATTIRTDDRQRTATRYRNIHSL